MTRATSSFIIGLANPLTTNCSYGLFLGVLFLVFCMYPVTAFISANTIGRLTLSYFLAILSLSILPLFRVPFRLNVIIFLFFSVGVIFFIINLFYQQNNLTREKAKNHKLSTFFLLLSFLIFCLMNLSEFHYDYLHAILQSLDLARTGSISSKWIESVGCDNWYLVAQTLSIVTDATEAVFTEKISGFMSRMTVLSLCIWICTKGNYSLKKKDELCLVLAFLLYFLYDSFISFRPHIYVGLLVTCFGLELSRKETFSLIRRLLFLTLLILSKRDGFVIGICLIPLVIYNLYFKEKVSKILCYFLISFLIVALFLFIGNGAQIGGESILSVFKNGLIKISLAKVIFSYLGFCSMVTVMLLFATYCVLGKDQQQRALFLILIIVALEIFYHVLF